MLNLSAMYIANSVKSDGSREIEALIYHVPCWSLLWTSVISSLMVHLHHHLLISWTFALGAQVLRLFITYIIVIHHDWRLGWRLRLSCWSFPFKRSLRTQWWVGVAWRLGCFFQQNLNYRWARFSKTALMILGHWGVWQTGVDYFIWHLHWNGCST